MFDVDLISSVSKLQSVRQVCIRSHWVFRGWRKTRKYLGLRAAGYRQHTNGAGRIPALRSLRLVVPGKILINSFIYEEPK